MMMVYGLRTKDKKRPLSVAVKTGAWNRPYFELTNTGSNVWLMVNEISAQRIAALRITDNAADSYPEGHDYEYPKLPLFLRGSVEVFEVNVDTFVSLDVLANAL